jgi:hypothetical protein
MLKLVVPRNEGAEASLTRRALWRTHQEINAATTYYERNLLLLRGRQYQTADAIIDEAEAQTALIVQARDVQQANLARSGSRNATLSHLGTDAEIITILGRLYAAIVPSVIGDKGTA